MAVPKNRNSKLALLFLATFVAETSGFVAPSSSDDYLSAGLGASKQHRLPENAEGVLYVNNHCINCAACSQFAPQSFARSPSKAAHIVTHQPETATELQHARQALLACPVAAIRVEPPAAKRQRLGSSEWTDLDQKRLDHLSGKVTDDEAATFPRPFLDSVTDVYWTGHHNSASFGAIPYLFRSNDDQWIMVDTPKFSNQSVRDVTSLTGPNGPDYLFLTHVDDTADHNQWKNKFPDLKRIFHSGDLGRHNWLGDKTLEDVEILLPPGRGTNDALQVYSLEGELLDSDDDDDDSSRDSPVILHTPGHSPGSICLYHPPAKILFTGDTYAFTTREDGRMTGFPRYGNDRRQQAQTLQRLVRQVDFELVAPGHGHPRDYRRDDRHMRERDMEPAVQELLAW